MADVIDFATRQRRPDAAPCRHRHISVYREVIYCADCGRELEPASAVRYLAAQLARQTAARTAAVRRARKLAGALRQARAAERPQPDLVAAQTRTDALASMRAILTPEGRR